MQTASLLNAIAELPILETGYRIGLDFLGQFARAIIEGVGIIGLGIIVFTLVLKAITLPFDIYQRVKMRKQTLIMRNMKDDLEKLQKQYANDKTLYNQKMMELQKKNGYSMLGACLPMIISIVILIVAFQGFRAYANYANLRTFEQMSQHYNAAILQDYGVDGKNYRLSREGVEDDVFTVTFEEGHTWTEDGVVYEMYSVQRSVESNGQTSIENVPYMRVTSEEPARYVFYIYNLQSTSVSREYQIDTDKMYLYLQTLPAQEKDAEGNLLYSGEDPVLTPAGATVKQIAEILQNASITQEEKNADIGTVCNAYVRDIGATAAAVYFRTEGPSFLWIRNVWFPDVSYSHPIPSYSSFKSQLNSTVTMQDGTKKKVANVISETEYNNLVSQLKTEQKQANGYFILIILSVGTMLLSQFITMKSNKETNKYQTVDGRGARTQKIMMVVMPLIYAVFAFMMSAAFSIYMVVSSIMAVIVTLLSNLIIGKVFSVKEDKKFKEEHSRTLPWMDKYGNKKSAGEKKKKK